MEAAIRWSSHGDGARKRFLCIDVSDSSLVLNEVDVLNEQTLSYHPVAKYNKLPHFAAFAWSSVQESLVAIGHVSGNASLIRLREDDKPSEVLTTFKIKQQRKCNSVAFSSQNWLAVAVDKTRSDVCLNIYDAGSGSDSQEPIRRLCAAELVSSVRFFMRQPQELVAATQRAYIRLYDLRDGYGSSSGGNLQASTRNVNNIAIDPLDENCFASAGSTGDPSVTVWDKRWMAQSSSSSAGSKSGAVFSFSPAVDASSMPATVWSLRYSGSHRGRLAISSSTGELRVIDMVEGNASALHESQYLPNNPYGGSTWRTNRYVSQTWNVKPSRHNSVDGGSRCIAFDWMTDQMLEGEQAMIALQPNREVTVLRVPTAKAHAEVTARQDLSLGFRRLSLTEATPYRSQPDLDAPHEQATSPSAPEDSGPTDYDPAASVVNMQGAGIPLRRTDATHVGGLLALPTLQRERCRKGYLFSCRKNAEIVAGNWQLERLWENVERLQMHAANNGMVYKSLDLSYIGVSDLWSEDVGNQARRQLSPSRTKIEEAIVGLNTIREFPAFDGERTDFPEHRQLCLAACGWKFTTETLEVECQELIDRGLYYQAIVQAVLHEHNHIALNLLRTLIRSKTIPNIGLGALLASNDINDEQREMCLWMSADTEDPALKALLTFLTTGNWRDVMKTNYLHLGYRVALGLKYLNDTELSGFIQTETARAIRNGDLEGVLLTGLSDGAMNLFQTYITKTNDLQTAVLATAFTNPLYVDDMRWDMWCETYFMQMQSWRAFNERTKFTVQHSRLARRAKDSGPTLVELPPQQVTLRCNHCQSSLARRAPTTATLTTATSNGKKVASPAVIAGTVCLTCGRHMPRCALCNLWLGVPDPSKSRATSAKDSKTEDKLARLLTFCVRCSHGFHAAHAKEWFDKHSVCPVPECQCRCGVV